MSFLNKLKDHEVEKEIEKLATELRERKWAKIPGVGRLEWDGKSNECQLNMSPEFMRRVEKECV